MKTLGESHATREKGIQYSILSLIALSILMSDWMFGLVAVSEILIGLLVLLIGLTDLSCVKSINYRFFIGTLLFFVLQFSYNLSVDMTFIFNRALFNVVKVFAYLFFINITYNYIRVNKLEKQFLVMLNIAALITILIGIYITLAILYFDHLPYEFLWSFTRSDLHSYRFRGPGFIVRTRSIFSEPAHMGYFLNMVIGVNVFSNLREKVPVWVNIVLIIGTILTLSYASIFVLSIILLFKLITLDNKYQRIKESKVFFLLSLIILAAVIYMFRDNLYQTVIVRTSDIISGGDNSAFVRLINSWLYVSRDTLLMGRGLGHTPPLQNVYAYFLSDMGIIPFGVILIFTAYLFKLNRGLGLTFVLLNFQKGGYLSPIFSILVLILLIFSIEQSNYHRYTLKGEK
ncbi:hypothetical protein ADIAL_1205 [Alkalibacterium sp. AK22]|uniref:hypothetical protein n=1 Tax=Alkalibacterium sp. AK22 TaxID=1229520 RepID=UPI0004499CC1|nr:hypothetical protein [Alkalibacterium sp. AK22]EXJ23297.1 hypothetical protein ADIAL_1205 [Alkalibacterium sp. AK22]